MKFRIHAFESVRRTYEVSAESIEAAYSMLDDLIDSDTPVDSEATGEYHDDVLIDPILPNGEVDFDNARWFLAENER